MSAKSKGFSTMKTTPPPRTNEPAIFSDEEIALADARIKIAQKKARRRTFAAITVAILAVLALITFALYPSLSRTFKRYRLQSTQDARRASMTSLERIHVELLPTWIIHIANQRDQAEVTQYGELSSFVEKEDPGALPLVEELRELLLQRDRVVELADSLLAIINLWNARQEEAGQPWWLAANVVASPRTSYFYVKSYKILADFDVLVDERPYRTRISARADNLNIVESMLGHTSPGEDGAFILADRLYDFSLGEIWPLLLEDPSMLEPRDAAFATYVRSELASLIDPSQFELLTRFATTRHELEQVLGAVRARRESCGSTFSIMQLPWNGFPEDQLDQLERYVDRDRYDECPSLTEEELATLRDATDTLQGEPRLQVAVEHLVSAVSRAIAVHEARHAADHHTANGLLEALSCSACDEGRLSTSARAELSAYLATFSSSPNPYTALYQTCSLDLQGATPHASALRFAFPRLGIDCDATPPEDLAARASALESTLFGRSSTIVLPAKKYPDRIELYRK